MKKIVPDLKFLGERYRHVNKYQQYKVKGEVCCGGGVEYHNKYTRLIMGTRQGMLTVLLKSQSIEGSIINYKVL